MSETDELRIIPVSQQDLPAISKVHLRAFPASALTQLGPEAVRRYYEWQLTGPHEHRFVMAQRDGDVVGFCVGGISQGSLAGFLRRNRLWLAIRLLTKPRLFLNPMIKNRVRTALTTLGLLQRRPDAPPPVQRTERSYGILSIAADPLWHGGGVGQLLMADAEREALARGFTRMRLTVAEDNSRAIGFYEKLGWSKVPQGGRWYGYMEKILREAEEPQ